jgi:Na+/H+-dicarboxylate symporter
MVWVAAYFVGGIAFCLLPYVQKRIDRNFSAEIQENYLARSLNAKALKFVYLFVLLLVVIFYPLVIISWVLGIEP